jgi:hypothetical protein
MLPPCWLRDFRFLRIAFVGFQGLYILLFTSSSVDSPLILKVLKKMSSWVVWILQKVQLRYTKGVATKAKSKANRKYQGKTSIFWNNNNYKLNNTIWFMTLQKDKNLSFIGESYKEEVSIINHFRYLLNRVYSF